MNNMLTQRGWLRRRGLWALLVMACLGLLAPVVASEPPVPEGGGLPRAIAGQWLGPFPWPVEAIHAFVLPTGKVLHFSFPGPNFPITILWDPVTGTFNTAAVDRPIFCSGHAFMPDGRLLVVGGSDVVQEQVVGVKDTHIFDPFTETWTRVGDMSHGRFYPSVVAMPDGRMLAFSGLDEFGMLNSEIAIYDPKCDAGWEVVSHIELPLYPGMQLLDSGHILACSPSPETVVFSPDGSKWATVVESLFGWRLGGLSVLLPTHDRVMIIGGVNPKETPPLPTASAEILELSGEPEPFWRYTQRMHFPRVDAKVLILPDGKVLVVGGASELPKKDGQPTAAVLHPELFDPFQEQWFVMNAMQIPRLQHATAILLPDGRVLAGGGNGDTSVEIFYPPYLFHGPRPSIAVAPEAVPFGGQFPVWSPQASEIGSVVMMRLSSATHWVNMDQRYVPLDFFHPSEEPGLLVVSAPEQAGVAPPGYYMLFILNAQQVPSVAHMIRLQQQPSIPGDLDDDGTVGITDLLMLLSAWGLCPDPPQMCPADLDDDGIIGILDLLTLLGNWG